MDCSSGGHSFPDDQGKCVECGKVLGGKRTPPVNNLERYQERVALLEGEIVGYRMVIESIRMIARQAPQIPTGPLFNLCNKTLQEKDGAELAQEFTLLRMFESGARHENEVAASQPKDIKGDPASTLAYQMWADSLSSIVKGQLEILDKLAELRLRGRQREASRLILPG